MPFPPHTTSTVFIYDLNTMRFLPSVKPSYGIPFWMSIHAKYVATCTSASQHFHIRSNSAQKVKGNTACRFVQYILCIHYQVISFDSTISCWTRKHGGTLHVPINCVLVSAYARNLIWIFNSKYHAHRRYGFAVASGQCQMGKRNSIKIVLYAIMRSWYDNIEPKIFFNYFLTGAY